MMRTFKYRLYPTKAQAVILETHLRLCCELYNAALQERRDAWKIRQQSISFRVQSAQLPAIKTERSDVKEVYAQVLQDTLHRVDKTFQSFFGRLKRGDKPGYPRFRSARRYDSLTYPQAGFAIDGHHLKLSRIGRIKIKLHRPSEGKLKTLTIKREAGKWYACFSVEVEPRPLPASSEAIGIDVGLTHFATLSNGTEIENPRHYRQAEKQLRIAQRKVARRKKGGRNRAKAIRLLQVAHARIRNQRSNFHHQLSRLLVNQNELIAVEDLNIKGLARSRLAKSINDAGWSSFINMLAYKAESAGRLLMKVDPRGTSQTCLCGNAVPKTLSDRWHDCSACGLSAPRDQVSAQLILGLGLSLCASMWPVAACIAQEA